MSNSTLERLREAAEFGGVSAKFGAVGSYVATVNILGDYTASAIKNALTARGWSDHSVTIAPNGYYTIATIKGTISNPANFDTQTLQLILKGDLTASGFTVGGITVNLSGGAPIQAIGGVLGQVQGVSGVGYYTVQAGDTLSKISAKTGVSVSELARLNGIANVNLISVGQVLKLGGTANANNVPQTITNTSGNNNVVLPAPNNQNWFDKNFFTGAGTLSALGIAALVVGGAVLVSRKR